LHDAIQCEQAGVPATVVITDVFPPVLTATGATLGAADYHSIVVEHPIWTRTMDWMEQVSEEMADQIVAQLTRS
jgi:hypothetical protein